MSEAQQKVTKDAPPPWLRKSALIVGAILLVVVLYLVGSAVLPRWWARTIGGQVNGVPSSGVLVGLFYGFLFTFIPIGVGALAAKPRLHWKARIGIGVAALLLTMPNLLTLAVALGTSEAARIGRAEIAVEAPSFRGATAVGVGIAIAMALVIGMVAWRLVTSRRELRRLRGKVAGNAVDRRARAERDDAAEEAKTRAARESAAAARAAAPAVGSPTAARPAVGSPTVPDPAGTTAGSPDPQPPISGTPGGPTVPATPTPEAQGPADPQLPR